MWIRTEQGWRQIPWIDGPLHGVYRPKTLDEAQVENSLRVIAYSLMVEAYCAGDITLEQVYTPWAEPILGAFGEVLR